MDHRSFRPWRPHPWHGMEPGPNPPEYLTAYIEMTPFDLVKYEVDKETGYIRVDRPQRSNSHPPALYGFAPRTLCGERVAALSPTGFPGDGDPLDLCVLAERQVTRADVIADVRVVGGLTMIDHEEIDDKIICVLSRDTVWNDVTSIDDLPPVMVERLVHYFSTYKWIPGDESGVVIEAPYDRKHALKVVSAAIEDYEAYFLDSTDEIERPAGLTLGGRKD